MPRLSGLGFLQPFNRIAKVFQKYVSRKSSQSLPGQVWAPSIVLDSFVRVRLVRVTLLHLSPIGQMHYLDSREHEHATLPSDTELIIPMRDIVQGDSGMYAFQIRPAYRPTRYLLGLSPSNALHRGSIAIQGLPSSDVH